MDHFSQVIDRAGIAQFGATKIVFTLVGYPNRSGDISRGAMTRMA